MHTESVIEQAVRVFKKSKVMACYMSGRFWTTCHTKSKENVTGKQFTIVMTWRTITPKLKVRNICGDYEEK